MRKIKITIALVLSIIQIFSLCGCNVFYAVVEYDAVREAQEIPKIGFSNEEPSNSSSQTVLSEEELYTFDGVADNYRSDFHFSLLNDKEKTVYTALEYALENGYKYIYFDERISDSNDTLEKVLDYLSLDSPLLEQNLKYEMGMFTSNYPVKHTKAVFEGNYIMVNNFTKPAFEKKLQAVEEAKKIVEKMPKNMSNIEKARYLHRIVITSIKYYDYDNNYKAGEDVCLYDGLIGKKTHCDGSTNMLALLYNLAGLKCFEKAYSGENVIGHTWNTVLIDGAWYNCDATALEEGNEDREIFIRRHFAFEDALQSYNPDYESIYPKCETSLGIKVGAILSSVNKSVFVKTVKDSFKANGEKIAILLINKADKGKANGMVQHLADELVHQVDWYQFDVINDKVALLIML